MDRHVLVIIFEALVLAEYNNIDAAECPSEHNMISAIKLPQSHRFSCFSLLERLWVILMQFLLYAVLVPTRQVNSFKCDVHRGATLLDITTYIVVYIHDMNQRSYE